MLRTSLFSLLVGLIPAIAVQVPLGPGHRWQDEHKAAGFEGGDPTEWNFNQAPDPNATDHLVFETVYSLLQFWPNIRMRNGHNIVPGTIPKGTLLYHISSQGGELPQGPEWVALDQEHSYNFCEGDSATPGDSQQGCLQLTLSNTRPFKVVYFDGKSAAKLGSGPLDTQDLLAWGELRPEYIWDETQRIQDLCAWGKDFGVDGFVRMEVAFEVMLCDFTSGVSVVSLSKIVAAQNLTRAVFESLNAGSQHNYFPGETRVHLDLAGLVSFYDTRLVPSLVPIRAGQERLDHRVGNVSSKDWLAVKSRLEAALIRPSDLSSGIDWKTLFQVIINRFAGRLQLTRYLLDSPVTRSEDLPDRGNEIQTQLRLMLTPFILLSATPDDPLDTTDLGWSISIYKLCATTHTKSLESEVNSMTESEKLLLWAARGTSREICRVVTKMWAAGVYVGIDSSLNTSDSPIISEIIRVWKEWSTDLDRLMAWLDWNVWVKCNPACGPEEICHLHRWPVTFPHSGDDEVESFTEDVWNIIKPGPEQPYRPQPKCVSLVNP